jgi:hypothetical protein
MNVSKKAGLAVLAGAAVLFGINFFEKKNAVKNISSGEENLNASVDESVTMTSSPTDDTPSENHHKGNKKSGFMSSMKKTQTVMETISRIVTCIYRVVECINEIFGGARYARSFCQGGSTTIII